LYTPHTDEDVAAMLAAIGVSSLEELVRVPAEIAPLEAINLPAGQAERDLTEHFTALSAENTAVGLPSFLGAGAYRHYVPPVIATLAMRGEFLTAYTPYQAEVSQGYLQAIYEWQTYIALLTGLDVANASVYDGATALAEGAIMAVNATGKRRIVLSRTINPQFIAVVKTYARGVGLEVTEIGFTSEGITDYAALEATLALGDVAAVALQSPNMFGIIEQPPQNVVGNIKTAGAVPIAVIAEALSLAVLTAPGDWGAEIAVGEAQSFGVALAYGGPYVGFIACSESHIRRIPGRLVGRTLDFDGKLAYTLTLQAREQHIRRERATSNICTNQAHCALIATIYLAAMGEQGLRDCATHNLERSHTLATKLSEVQGVRLAYKAPYFNEFVLEVPGKAKNMLDALCERGILGGVDLGRWYPELENHMLVTATEVTTDAEITAYVEALRACVAGATHYV
jgi:glycine dehydrogenase subunit 1